MVLVINVQISGVSVHRYVYILQCTFYVKRQPGCRGSCSLLHLKQKCTVLGQVTYFHYKRANARRTVMIELFETTGLKRVCASGVTGKLLGEVGVVDE